MSKTKTQRQVEQIADDRGWAEVQPTSSGHLQLRHPNDDVPLVHAAMSPGDNRWRENLIRDMRQAERKGGVLNGDEPPEDIEEDEGEAPQEEGERCQYCDAGPYQDGRGRAAHEAACEENPDAWKPCRYCGQPCKGPGARTNHENNWCPERPEVEGEEQGKETPEAAPEEPPEPPEPPRPPEPSPTPRQTLQVRRMLVDLLREYDELDAEARSNGFLEPALTFRDTLDTTAELIVETVNGTADEG